MAQINLLSKHYKSQVGTRQILDWVIRILLAFAVLFVAYYVFLVFRIKAAQKEQIALKTHLVDSQKGIFQNTEREELITRQGQLSVLNILLEKHMYWSKFFPQLARATVRSAAYVSISAVEDGSMNLVVSVPNYSELDKFLQVFDLPQFNKIFSEVKIMSVSRSQEDKSLSTRFQIQLKFDPGILKANPPEAEASQ